MSATVLEARELEKRFGALAAVDRVSLAVGRGERLALIGPNGAGKSTLFALLAGELRPDHGSVHLLGHDVTRWPPERRARLGLGRSFQRNRLFPGCTVRDHLALALLARRGLAGVFWRDPARGPELRRRVEEEAGRLGLREALDVPVEALAYGERRQVELAVAMAGDPPLLLLDEPTAGMAPAETGRVLALLERLPPRITVVLVEHDLDLVFAFARRVVVLDSGRIVFEGTPAEARASPVVREVYMGAEEAA
ncbi:Lipopolysaccharide export system ATP-binding protein LptB [bacterium HR39]|nr:Lipopolysaccharide export system ATP-binding protein LptB [bacterium HR39]